MAQPRAARSKDPRHVQSQLLVEKSLDDARATHVLSRPLSRTGGETVCRNGWRMQKQINGSLVIGMMLLTSTSADRVAETAGSAIRALKALHSALSVGLTNRDYQQRLIDTNIIVDQYLETPRAGERSVQSIVERAMIIDRMALSVWNARLMSDDRVPLATIDALHEFPSVSKREADHDPDPGQLSQLNRPGESRSRLLVHRKRASTALGVCRGPDQKCRT